MADPTLESTNGSGTVIARNNNWKDTDQAVIQATGMAPPYDAESAIVASLIPGNYTAIVRGNGGTTASLWWKCTRCINCDHHGATLAAK